jgi:hypothetical protein
MAYNTRSDTLKLQRLIQVLKDRGSNEAAANLESKATDFLNDVKPKYKPGDIPHYDGTESDDGSSYVEGQHDSDDEDDEWGEDWEEDTWEDCVEEAKPVEPPPKEPTPPPPKEPTPPPPPIVVSNTVSAIWGSPATLWGNPATLRGNPATLWESPATL